MWLLYNGKKGNMKVQKSVESMENISKAIKLIQLAIGRGER